MRASLLLALALSACRNECIEDGVDICALCEPHPIACPGKQFVLTWGCHWPPSEFATQRSCEALPPACENDRTCACVKAGFDAGNNCSPGLGAACTVDGGVVELYCNPP